MKIIFWMFFTLFDFSAYADSSGLTEGDVFFATTIEGKVTVLCSHVEVVHECKMSIIKPRRSRFYTSINERARKVVIKAHHESGNIVKKHSNLMKGGQSSTNFNLWTQTAWNEPLLAMGKNTIEYILYFGDEELESGSFEVLVKNGGQYTCKDGYLTKPGWNCYSSRIFCDEYLHSCR